MLRVIAITTLLFLCAAVPARATGAVTPLPGTGEPGPVSCWAPGDCILTTAYQNNADSIGILSLGHSRLTGRQLIRRGTLGAPEDVEGLSCPSATVCFATGLRGPASTGASGGYIAQITRGRLGHVLTFPKIEDVDSIACSADAVCFAVGMSSGVKASDARSYFFVLHNGALVSTQSLGAIYPESIGCDASLDNCMAVGVDVRSGAGATVSITRGTPAPLRTLSWSPALVACPSSSSCLVGGYTAPNTSGTTAKEYLSVATHGVLARARTTDYGLGGIACTSTTLCYGLADLQQSAGPVAITHGVPASPRVLPGVFGLTNIACVDHWCLADGTATPGTKGIYTTF